MLVLSRKKNEKIVIDEIFEDGYARIIVQGMRKGYEREQFLEDEAWGKYRSEYVPKGDLGGLLTKKQHNEVREGRVFLIHERGSRNIYPEYRKKVKELTKQLLEKEGFIADEVDRRLEKFWGDKDVS